MLIFFILRNDDVKLRSQVIGSLHQKKKHLAARQGAQKITNGSENLVHTLVVLQEDVVIQGQLFANAINR